MALALDKNLSSLQVAIVGGGNMGQAILAGWISTSEGPAAQWTPESFVVVNPGEEKRKHITARYGVRCVAAVSDLPESDIVVLAVKPQKMFDVLDEMAVLSWLPSTLCISIAAGIPTNKLQEALPEGCTVIRAMPNTPLLIGQGVTTLCAGSTATSVELDFACALFASIGAAHAIPEDLIDASSAISGSGPAYAAALIEALADAGVCVGLDRQLAEDLARDTLAGTGAMMQQQHASAYDTRVAVCSPGGSTLAALDAFEAGGFSQAIHDGVKAAVARSKELGQ